MESVQIEDILCDNDDDDYIVINTDPVTGEIIQ